MNLRFKFAVVGLSSVLVALMLVGAVLGQNTPSSSTDPYRHLDVFTEVFAKIKSDYVEEPDMNSVTLGAINGLLVSVDPFASYLSAEQYKQYRRVIENPKAGVGLLLSRKYGYEIGIVDAIPGSPADKAGLATGDIIEAINGISTRDMPLAFADVLLHGEPGTTVKLTVLRLRRPEPAEIVLTRAVIKPPPPSAKMLTGEVGLVQVTDLPSGKSKEVAQLVQGLVQKGAKKIILDLRHCAAGTPEEGIALANLFVAKGTLGSLSGQKTPKQSFEADPSKVVYQGPLVVLTNRGTTGAAEVAAAALLESKRAEIVGERTYGDAAVRKTVSTEDGGAVLLAVAKYYTPSGKPIQESSVTPTYAVMESAADTGDETQPDRPEEPQKPEDDLILKKALEVLSGNVQKAESRPGLASLPAGGMQPPGLPRRNQ
jgi:carboxyl-terminal processing protease